ncbi:hypothetical protein ACQ4PT_037729 [Festuca glaucescens]
MERKWQGRAGAWVIPAERGGEGSREPAVGEPAPAEQQVSERRRRSRSDRCSGEYAVRAVGQEGNAGLGHKARFAIADYPRRHKAFFPRRGLAGLRKPAATLIRTRNDLTVRVGDTNIILSFPLHVQFRLEPGEYLTSVEGHYGQFNGIVVVRSLKFVSNIRTYGSYGKEDGVAFALPAGASGKIVGFHFKCGQFIDAIGTYVKMD